MGGGRSFVSWEEGYQINSHITVLDKALICLTSAHTVFYVTARGLSRNVPSAHTGGGLEGVILSRARVSWERIEEVRGVR